MVWGRLASIEYFGAHDKAIAGLLGLARLSLVEEKLEIQIPASLPEACELGFELKHFIMWALSHKGS